MEQGLSDGAIADALGLSLRTVRRRVSEASEELGADSRFALGVAWADRR
jgi:DNA-binding NarL/FixJ family response regulator